MKEWSRLRVKEWIDDYSNERINESMNVNRDEWTMTISEYMIIEVFNESTMTYVGDNEWIDDLPRHRSCEWNDQRWLTMISDLINN